MNTITLHTPSPRLAMWRGRFQGRPANPSNATRPLLAAPRLATPPPRDEGMSYEEQEELLRRLREAGL